MRSTRFAFLTVLVSATALLASVNAGHAEVVQGADAEPSAAASETSAAAITRKQEFLRPKKVEKLAGGMIRSEFEGGFSHVGGSIEQMHVVYELHDGEIVGVTAEAVLGADQGYRTPAEYRGAGRAADADLAALLKVGRPEAYALLIKQAAEASGSRVLSDDNKRPRKQKAPTYTTLAVAGEIVQSGCSKIDIASPVNMYAYGCYQRKLAQTISNGEYLGETAQVTCQSKSGGGDMYECGNDLRHAYASGYSYIVDWAPNADQYGLTGCVSKTWGLSFNGISYSQGTTQCPTEYRIRIEGNTTYGANFANGWFGSVRYGNNRAAAAVDTYRWQAPTTYRGNFRYSVTIKTGARRKSCVGTCTTY